MQTTPASNDGLRNPEMGGGNKEKNNKSFDYPEPSLWNSQFGRRAFLKKTGAATASTAIALHGFRMEVLAGVSASKIWQVSAQGGSSPPSNETSTPSTEGGVPVQWTRSTVVTYSPNPQNANQIQWGSSATSTVTVTVTVQKMKYANGQWASDGPPLTCTHSRSKTATIDSSTGNLTFSQDNSEDQDNQQDGISVTINPTATPSITVTGPVSVQFAPGTLPASPKFGTRQVAQ